MTLDEAERHHLVDVLRAEAGARLQVFDGGGREATVRITAIHRRAVDLEVEQQHQQPTPPVSIWLFQAVPREQQMDFILQKATELGVSVIQPVTTDHAVVRLEPGDAGKHERWSRIVLGAAKQCGTAWLPTVEPVRPVLDALRERPPLDRLIVCSLEPDTRPLRDLLRADPKPKRMGVLIGPEGDFSAREYAAARAAGATPVTLGRTVLRVETASLYALSAIRYEFT